MPLIRLAERFVTIKILKGIFIMFNSSYYKLDQIPDSLQISGIGELRSFLSMRIAYRVIKAALLLKPFVFPL